MSGPHRESPRVEPPFPTIVAIVDGRALVAFGVVADLSKAGGCIWTDVRLKVGAMLHLRLSFAYPPEVHALSATVAWTECDANRPWEHAYRSGVRWLDLGYTLRQRVRQLVQTAGPRPGTERYLFEQHWVVGRETPRQRPPVLGPLPQGEGRRRPGRGNEALTLPPGSRLPYHPGTDGVTSPGDDEPPFPDSCPTCSALHQGRREFRWPVSACPRCRHLRYGQPGLCACQPRHSDPEPLERMLLGERTARRPPARAVSAGNGLPVASGQ